MKKTILTIMVAAMMLVAFTACEQQMPTYKNADYLTIVQNTAFIEGQDFNANNFEVVVHYTDGSTSTIPGAGVVTATWAKGAAKDSTVSAKLTDALKVDSFDVNVIDLDDCEISVVLADDATTSIKPTATENEVRNVIVKVESVTYSAEGITYEATAADYTAVASINGTQLKTADTYTVDANVYTGYVSDESRGTKVATVETTVEVTPAKDTAEHVVGFEVLYSVDSAAGEESDVTDATSLSNLWIGDKVTIRLVQVIEKEGVRSYRTIEDASKYQTANLSTGISFTNGVASNITVGKTNLTGNAYYYDTEISSSTQAKNISIPAGKSTVTGTATVTADADKYPAAGTTLTGNSDLSGYVKVTGLSNTDTDIKDVAYTIVVDPAMSFTIPASGSVNVYYFLSYNSYGEDVVIRGSVPLQAKAATPATDING